MIKLLLKDDEAVFFLTEIGWLPKIQSMMDVALVNKPDDTEIAAIIYRRIFCPEAQAKALVVMDEMASMRVLLLCEIAPSEEAAAIEILDKTLAAVQEGDVGQLYTE